MLRSGFWQKAFCFALGIAVVVFAVGLIARTAALAVPEGFFAWFKQAGSIEAGLFLWDLVVTYGLGIGLPAFIALLVAFRFFVAATASAALAFLAGVLLTVHVLAPLWFGYSLDMVWQRPWFAFAMEASLGLAALAAWFIARRRASRAPSAAAPLGAT